MPKRLFEPCLPTRGNQGPCQARSGFHEIKQDCYRLIVQREGKRARLFTKNGHDWTKRYPRMVAAWEENPEFKSMFEKQSGAYRRIAARFAKQLGVELPAISH
jgi:ATP-dependent DNA ligase